MKSGVMTGSSNKLIQTQRNNFNTPPQQEQDLVIHKKRCPLMQVMWYILV